MTSYVFDIETDDIKATRIWCLSLLDTETKEQFTYGPSELFEGLEMLKKADKLIGHNILGFDIPVIKNITGVDLYDKELVDTLILSRLFNPIREEGHSLEAWGFKLNYPKIDFEEYSTFSVDMIEYCERDVSLNYKLYEHLKSEATGFSKKSVELEHDVAVLINNQRTHGFLFDFKYGMLLLSDLTTELENNKTSIQKDFLAKKEVIEIFPKYNSKNELLKTGITASGKGVRLSAIEYKTMAEESKVTRINIEEFNPGSRKQIGIYLEELGWIPEEHTPTGQPKIDEKILSQIEGIPQAELLSNYLMLQKRIAQLKSWLDELDPEDTRIRGYVNPLGTVTTRMTHRSPNTAQVPSVSSPYGKECRTCWTVPKNYKLVGIDASGLELRMLAHYMNDKDYINEIINGDIHTANQKLAGLESRDQAKTFIYALIYGAGNARLGSVAKGSERTGKKLRDSFISNLPSFEDLRSRIDREASRTGKVKALDGRSLIVRNLHSALNTLLQGAGAIVMKEALVIFSKHISDMKANIVANVHDEWQVEAHQDIADLVGELGVKAIRESGDTLKLNCPLDGEYKVGNNWSETH